MQFIINDTMTKGLSLSGAELLVYAYISSDEYGGENIAEWFDVCGAGTLSTVRRALKSLEERGYIKGVRDSVTSPMVYEILDLDEDEEDSSVFDEEGHIDPRAVLFKKHGRRS